MRCSLYRLRRHRGLLAFVVVTWLPYMSVRCVEGAAGGCAIVEAANAPHGIGSHDDHAAHGHDHHDGHADARDVPDPAGGKLPGSEHTCCELTGKCAVEITPWTPRAETTLAVAPVQMPDLMPVAMAERSPRRVADLGKHPPPYIRFAALLI